MGLTGFDGTKVRYMESLKAVTGNTQVEFGQYAPQLRVIRGGAVTAEAVAA